MGIDVSLIDAFGDMRAAHSSGASQPDYKPEIQPPLQPTPSIPQPGDPPVCLTPPQDWWMIDRETCEMRQITKEKQWI